MAISFSADVATVLFCSLCDLNVATAHVNAGFRQVDFVEIMSDYNIKGFVQMFAPCLCVCVCVERLFQGRGAFLGDTFWQF